MLKFTKAKRQDDGTIPSADIAVPFFGYKSQVSIAVPGLMPWRKSEKRRLRRGFLTLEEISGHFVEFSHPTGARSGILTILCFWRRVLNAVRVSRPEKAVLVEAM